MVITENTFELDLAPLEEKVIEYMRNIKEYYNQDPKYIICGPKQVSEMSIGSPFGFNMAQGKYAGMIILVLPWFDGVLLLPDLKKLKMFSDDIYFERYL